MRLVGSLVRDCLKTICVLFLLAAFSPQQATASTVPYKVTDGFSTNASGAFFVKFFTIPFSTGRMVLSSTPDGTGSARIGDRIVVFASYPGQGEYDYKAKPDCKNGSSILPPTDLTYLFFKVTPTFPNNVIGVQLRDWCGGTKTIGPIYLVNIDDSDKPIPFLDLPWEYQKKGLSFNIAATSINSFFDHEYPLLSRIGALPEPEEAKETVVSYAGGARSNRLDYSSHDGYDYGLNAKVSSGDPVTAAAGGLATRHGSCEVKDGKYFCDTGCGMQIWIDHQNGFQTRYCHLGLTGLISTGPDNEVHVEKGQEVGKVDLTGRTTGPHIHFMVVQDKNHDGNFEDNIPDGLVDPFGWQSSDPDPWENYAFNYLGQDRTGSKSHYLWTTQLASANTAVPTNGTNVGVDPYNIATTANTNNNKEFELKAFLTPIVSPSVDLGVLGPGIVIDAFDILGNVITTFTDTFTLTVDFAEIDLSRYDPSTIFLYSSSDGENWVKEEATNVDLINKKATVQINHLTQFALMAERLDTTAPITSLIFDGIMLGDDVYGNSVTASLEASDGAGLGVDYTAFSMDGGDWQVFTDPIVTASEGAHRIQFYSADNDENIEQPQTKEFTLVKDSDPPVTSIELSGDAITANTYRSDVSIALVASDGAGFGVTNTFYNLDGTGWQEYVSGFTISNDGEHSIAYYSTDKAGNTEEAKITNFSIKHVVDTTPPELTTQFDPTRLDFSFQPFDASGPASLSIVSDGSSQNVIASDAAGNTLKLQVIKKKTATTLATLKSLTLQSLQYNHDVPITLGQEKFSILYSPNSGTPKVLVQTLENAGVMLSYISLKKKTYVFKKTGGQWKFVEELSGMRMLQLSTNEGRLEYRY